MDSGGLANSLPISIVDAVYQRVKQEILSGKYSPGTALKQDDVADRLGVSKIPLREAFSRLEGEGMLVLRPRRGYALPSFEIPDIMEIFELRAMLESHATRQAATVRTEVDVAELRKLAKAMATLDPNESSYFAQWSQFNREFHQVLITASRKKHVIRIALQLRDIVEPYIRLETFTTGNYDDQADHEHDEIVDAFANGDAQKAGELIARHCFNTRDRLIATLNAAAAARQKP